MSELDRQNDIDDLINTSGPHTEAGSDASPLLPFVGRAQELDHLLSFVGKGTSGASLSLLWIEGEGGVGKSRLLKEAKKRIAPEVLIVHVCFRPDATFSLPKLLAAALTEAGAPLHIDARHPSESVSSVLASLRELGRLQPTLLVLEDVHLLDAKGVADMVTVMHGMEYERLCIVCLARPGNETAFGAALPFLTETIELKPLTLQAIRRMGTTWGYDLNRLPNLTRFLYERTRGIPLVIESAVYNLLVHRPELKRNPVATVRSIAGDTEQSLTHGLTVGLSAQDMEGARRLATLGETFSMQGAAALLDAPEEQVDRLRRAGILTQSFDEVAPLFGRPSELARYSFSHSLLHERLLSEAPPPDSRSLELLESDVPLCSTTFFTYLAQTLGSGFPSERIAALLERLLAGTENLIDSPNWKAASIIHASAKTIFRRYRKSLPEERVRLIRFHLLRLRLQILNAFPSHPDFIAAADELLALTDNPRDREQALQRLTALEYSIFRTDEGWTFRAETVFDETERLIERFPDILLDPLYISLLGNITGALRVAAPLPVMERAWSRFGKLLAAAEATGNEEARHRGLLDIAPSFLFDFRTEEELEERKNLAEKIAAECEGGIPEGRFAISWPRFLESIGEMQRAKEVLTKWTSHPLSGYNLSREFALRMLELIVDSALGASAKSVEEAAVDILEEFQNIQKIEEGKEGDVTLAQTSVAAHIVLASIMRGEIAWGNELALRLCKGNERISHYMEFERAVLSADTAVMERLLDSGQVRPDILPLVAYALGRKEADRAQVVETARKLLEGPIIQRSGILSLRLVLALLGMTARDPERDLQKMIGDAVYKATEAGTQWLAAHKLPAYLHALLRDMQFLIEAERQTEHGNRNKVPESRHTTEEPRTQQQPTPERIAVTVVGAITYTLPGKKTAKVRGPRPQQLLGLLAANELLASPISLADFRLHVTGSTAQEESANYLRVLVSRMRKQLGHDAIISDGESAPRLNTAQVSVDLIEATGLIRQALSMARNHRADQAREALIKGLEILAGGEPYPGLSGQIFAAARKELRSLLHRSVTITAKLLLQGNQRQRATELIHLGLTVLKEDEELAKMLEEL